MRTFDLLDEPWLSCAMQDGNGERFGLCALLEKAHEIRELAEPSPLDQFGAHRLLFAIAHWLRATDTVEQSQEPQCSHAAPTGVQSSPRTWG